MNEGPYARGELCLKGLYIPEILYPGDLLSEGPNIPGYTEVLITKEPMSGVIISKGSYI